MYKAFVYFLFIKIILSPSFVNAQSFTDSLQNKSYDELENIYRNHLTKDTLVAKKILQFFIEKAKNNKDTTRIADGYFHYINTASDIKMLHYADSIIALTEHKQSKNYPAWAYYAKATFFLMNKRNIKKSLDNFTKARNLAEKNNNVTLLHRVYYGVGIIRSEYLGEKEESLKLFKACEKFYQNKLITDDDPNPNTFRLLHILHAISETYIDLQKLDSASFYNTTGYKMAIRNEDAEIRKMKSYFTYSEGVNLFTQKRYTIAIDSIENAIPIITDRKDNRNVLDGYFYLGSSYFYLNKKEKAVIYFKKTDSLLQFFNTVPHYKHIEAYKYLKTYYQEKGNQKNQLLYLNKLLKADSLYRNDYNYVNKKIKNDYDFQTLVKERDGLIQELNIDNASLQKDRKNYLFGIAGLSISIFILGGLLYHQYSKKQGYRLRFEKLMKEQDIVSVSNRENNKKENQPILIDKELKVPEKHINYILGKLEEFEENHNYLTLGMSSQSLANEMETNIKYLSRVINYYKGKTFTNYLNELRINYAVKELKENTTLRKFTIKAIANEVGYNSAETFSNAFYKQTKIKPSYFIKQLEKNKNS